MPKHVLLNATAIINGVDLSDHIDSVTLTLTKAEVDVTAMGATAKQRLAGIRDDSISLVMFSDFDAGKVDATLYPLFNSGTTFSVKFSANTTAYSATNPSYSGSAILLTYSPLAGKVGAANMMTINMPSVGALVEGTT